MGDVQLDEGTFMEGFAGVNGTLTNAGTVYVNWKRYADEALGKTSSTVYDDAHAHTLKIAGDYVGEGGTLVFNGALAGDDSPVDTIEVAGSASGTGKVQVHNLGGKGDLTSPHGITLITIEGDSTLNLSQDGRIVAGAYDYVLLRDPDSRRSTCRARRANTRFRPTCRSGRSFDPKRAPTWRPRLRRTSRKCVCTTARANRTMSIRSRAK